MATNGRPKTRAEAEKLLGKRTPLPGADKPRGANWDKKPVAAAPKGPAQSVAQVFRTKTGEPVATKKRMKDAGL